MECFSQLPRSLLTESIQLLFSAKASDLLAYNEIQIPSPGARVSRSLTLDSQTQMSRTAGERASELVKKALVTCPRKQEVKMAPYYPHVEGSTGASGEIDSKKSVASEFGVCCCFDDILPNVRGKVFRIKIISDMFPSGIFWGQVESGK